MRRARLSDLGNFPLEPHMLSGLIPGKRLYKGGLSFHAPGEISHDADRPHVEVDHEVFCLLQGQGWIEVDGVRRTAGAGDIIIIEPGEDHHLISSMENPFVNLWLHADDEGHPRQK